MKGELLKLDEVAIDIRLRRKGNANITRKSIREMNSLNLLRRFKARQWLKAVK